MDNPTVSRWLTRPEGLASRLDEARLGAGLSSAELSRVLGWTTAKVSRIRNGRTMPSVEDVEAWAKVCKLSRPETKVLLDELAGSRSMHLKWQARQRSGTDHQQDYNDLYAASDNVTVFSTVFLPGPLQSEAYAYGVLSIWDQQRNRKTKDLREAAKLREARAAAFADPSKSFRFIISADVPRWQYCSSDDMTAALERVAALAALPNVHIHVIDPAAGHVQPATGFGIYGDVVIIEMWTGEHVIDDPDGVEQYQAIANMLIANSLDSGDGIDLLLESSESKQGTS